MLWPGKIPAGTTCDELTSTMDLYPSFVDLANGKMDKAKRDGKNISDLILGEEGAKSPHEVYAYYYLDQLQAVRSGPWKLFLPLEDFAQHPHFNLKNASDKPLLFNVDRDMSCQYDVAAEHTSVIKELTKLAEGVRADLGDRDAPGPGIRKVGYVKNPLPIVMIP